MTLFPPAQGFGGGGSIGSGSLQPFSKDVTVLTPTTTVTVVAWRAPFACTVVKVWGYQDTGTGSVVTAERIRGGSVVSDLLVTDLTINANAFWLDGGPVQNVSFIVSDALLMKIASVSGNPNYISIQVDFSQP